MKNINTTMTTLTSTQINETVARLTSEMEAVRERINERYERIGRGETDMDDCFVSNRMNSLELQVIAQKIEIAQNGGLWSFPCLRDITTNEVVSYRTVNGQYGLCWVIDDDAMASKFGRFVGIPKKESTYTKKGLKESEVELPAIVKTVANGSGMMGAYCSSVCIFPTLHS